MKKKLVKKTVRKDKKNILKDKIIDRKVNYDKKDFVDVCSIIVKCNIEEISKYLLSDGKKKSFPDITTRE